MNPDQKQSEHRTTGQSRKYDLEERLLGFASAVIDLCERLPNSRAGNHMAGQFLRAGTSPYGNHGEAQAPESADDFIHKMKICLKELREPRRWGRSIAEKQWLRNDSQLPYLLQEVEELIRIFKASVQTAERNRLERKRGTRTPTPRAEHSR